ncbi:MAG TPA: hypothetical protein DGH68_00845 [Bacteroidetes bacterium]|nr:hypothetical protein [Bacteroidota bacterium]
MVDIWQEAEDYTAGIVDTHPEVNRSQPAVMLSRWVALFLARPLPHQDKKGHRSLCPFNKPQPHYIGEASSPPTEMTSEME